MSDKKVIIGHDLFIQEIFTSLKQLKQGKGKVFLINGESGFGKTHLLTHIFERLMNESSSFVPVFSENQKPIGKFNISNMQPFYPFARLIEQLIEKKHLSPEKRFARNVGMTALASIPLVGDVFYAVKELGRDWREFKREKSSADEKKISSATADYFDSLLSFADKEPIVACIDDMHWSDGQSIELLSLISERISKIPLILLVTYKESEVERQGLPLFSYLKKYSNDKDNIKFYNIKVFDSGDITDLCKLYFTNYKKNIEFESWISERSFGVPGVVSEYLRYFSRYSPFGPDGELVTNFKDNEFLPATVQALFAQNLENINDEERNLLSICAIEGREFTASIVSQLLNTDILTTIKKLRALANKTGLIKSLGAKNRYGIKTTVYQFTQAFYQSFFEASLEYEEYTALHSQIAGLLKEKYDEALSAELKEEIAPYIAAHSAESGDTELTEDMLLFVAENAKKYGSSDLVKKYYEDYLELNKEGQDSDFQEDSEKFQSIINELELQSALHHDSGSGSSQNGNGETEEYNNQINLDNFEALRSKILDEYLNSNFEECLKICESCMHSETILNSPFSKSQIHIFMGKAFSELKDYDKAELNFLAAETIANELEDNQISGLLLNAYSVHYSNKGFRELSYQYLKKAVNLSNQLPLELKLLTLSNIALLTRKLAPADSKMYFDLSMELSRQLDFKLFETELKELFD